MSYFDDASLAFLPKGAPGKDGKAYSIKPTNGDGDFTFSRGSNLAATRVGPTGLIEKGRENILKQSNDFNDSEWEKFGSPTFTANQNGYDGSSDAWLFTNGGGAYIYQNESTAVATYSIYAKAGDNGSGDFIYLFADAVGGRYFDLANGTLSTEILSNLIESKIEPVSGATGWYRCSIVVPNSTRVRVYAADSSTGSSGDTTGSIYIQNAQLEIGLAATDYIESGATTGKAGILEDQPRFDYSGGATCPSLLLEPSRTNLIGYSEYAGGWSESGVGTITENAAVSPEGLRNAFTLNDTSNSDYYRIERNVSVPNGDSTLSVFLKKTTGVLSHYAGIQFNAGYKYVIVDTTNGTWNEDGGTANDFIDIEDFSDYYWRVIIRNNLSAGSRRVALWPAISTDGGNLSVGATGENTFYGLQVEAGSYPTSYIPNHSGGSVTRGEDFMSQSSNAANFNDSEGTIFFDGVLLDNSDGKLLIMSVDAGNLNDRIRIDVFSQDLRFTAVKDSSTLFVESNIMSLTAGTRYKIAVRYKANDYALYVNGVSVYTNTSVGTWDSGDLVRFSFSEGNDSSPTEANVNQALYFPTGLSNADLETLTT
jgi:hypothetical protein